MRRAVPALVGVGLASLVAVTLAGAPAEQPLGADLGPVGWRDSSGAVSTLIEPLAGTVGPGSSLVFASFNVCKVDCAPPAPPWEVRRDRVARVIGESGLDVVGLQEATHQPTPTAMTQYIDVQNLARPYGFAPVVYTDSSDQCLKAPRRDKICTHTTGILFNTGTVRQASTPNGSASAGTLPMSMMVPGLPPDAAPRKVTWAYLEGLSGTGVFLAVSAHLSNVKDAANEAGRVAFGAALDDWAAAWNDAHGLSGVPVVLMGDLNSYRKRQPRGVQQVLASEGWIDAATATQKRNVQFSTINHNPLLGLNEQGFPSKPYQFKTSKRNPVLDATRIDYVMAKGEGVEVLDYEVVIRLNADGTFNADYQASDHQMVRATLSFPSG